MNNRVRFSLFQPEAESYPRALASLALNHPLSAQSYFGYNRRPQVGNTLDFASFRQPIGGGYFA